MNQLIEDFKNNLEKIKEELKKELSTLRVNRPSPVLIEDIFVNYYNQKLMIKQLGSISVNPPRELLIHVWDKNAVNPIIGALENADMGFSVKNEGNLIRVYLPELSQERKEEVIKKAKKIVEDFRIKVRNLRDDFIKKVKKSFEEKEIDEDLMFKLKEKIQENVEEINEKIEEMLENKIQEINL